MSKYLQRVKYPKQNAHFYTLNPASIPVKLLIAVDERMIGFSRNERIEVGSEL